MQVAGNLRSVLVALTIAASLSAPIAVRAAEPAAVSASEAKKIELLRRYFKAVQFDKLMDGMVGSMNDSMMTSLGKDIPEELRRPISDAARETIRDVMPMMMADMEVAMAKVFTAEELEAAVTFYESPAGRSIAAKSQQLTTMSGEMMAKYAPVMQEQMTKRLCDKLGCKDKPSGKGA